MVHAPALMVGDQPVDVWGFKYPAEAVLLSSSVFLLRCCPMMPRNQRARGTEKPCLARSSTLLGTRREKGALQQDFFLAAPRR